MQLRKAIYAGSEDEARALLARAPSVELATTGADGHPILRTLHAVLDGDGIAFHGAPAGEKIESIGRAAVVGAHETIASIPSYFLDPERACPATTYYVSAQAHGTIEEVDDARDKARILQALMEKYQPEGGYARVASEDPLYTKAVRGILVGRVQIERIVAKAKLGQNRRPEERVRVLDQLWRRGGPGDVRAIATILSRFPDLPPPSFLPRARGVRFQCTLGDDEIEEAIRLLDHAYWLHRVPPDRIREALLRSEAVVGARDEAGYLVALARAVSDGKVAWIYDVIVDPSVRNGGLGNALMTLLLDHPAVRRAVHIRLTTRDAMSFYRRLGFVELAEAPRHPWPSTEMIRTPR
jgi:nitroimidazol reductase NimA-like FMN-containing flavoprotein (pyridoxamine 5'-phosphate oxidase superfamily)/ribosomal protein S18 acetylase RimI-like enzyme